MDYRVEAKALGLEGCPFSNLMFVQSTDETHQYSRALSTSKIRQRNFLSIDSKSFRVETGATIPNYTQTKGLCIQFCDMLVNDDGDREIISVKKKIEAVAKNDKKQSRK